MRKKLTLILPFLGLTILLTVFSIKAPDTFPTKSNALNVITRTSPAVIVGMGMTFVIISGGIDLSVGSVIAISGVTCAMAASGTGSVLMGILAGMGTGALCGLVNGALISFGGIAPFIVTLGMMSAIRGAVLVMTNAMPVSENIPANFSHLYMGDLPGGIPIPIAIMLVVVLICAFILHWTPLGRYTFAIGSNRDAAFHSGVPINRTLMMIYILIGILGGLSGVMLAAELESGQPTSGQFWELRVIAGVVIGGASLMGGEGGVLGTIAGMLFIIALENGCRLSDISAHYQHVALGAAIIVAALIDKFARWRMR
ncbi:MAG TPA: ABC transporter permease [Candidatus Brocadiia bacterium]|nr:ABC transporter permease [Candidatus Brocadiia bacterium]